MWLLWLAGCSAAVDKASDTDAVDTDSAALETDTAVDTDASVDTDTAVDTDTVVDTDTAVDTDQETPSFGFSVVKVSAGAPPPPCDEATLRTLLDTTKTWQTGRSCAFASAGFANADATVAVKLHLKVDDSDALTVGEKFQVTWDPLAGVSLYETTGSLTLEQGTNLFETFCNDYGDAPTVTRSWTPIDGFMLLEVTEADEAWEPWGAPFTGDVVIRGVVLEAQDGSSDTCTVPDIDLKGLHLGWLPG